jgi:hypothetical protein
MRRLPAAGGAIAAFGAVAIVAACGGTPKSKTPAVRASSDPIVASLERLAQRQQANIPQALPPGYKNNYTEAAFEGWPVRPLHSQHPIRGSFLDPRGQDENGLAGYHFGIDVNVDDRHPEPGAPTGLSHRVYAVDGGAALVQFARQTCPTRRIEVGHFSYWHVSPVVTTGARIKAGQMIGWTCLGQWHVHLSEWRMVGGRRVWLNPLRPGSKIAPYVDTEPPIVSAMRFFTPPRTPWHPTVSLKGVDTATPLTPTGLFGRVELRAEIEDGQSFWGFMTRHPAWEAPHHPYRVAVEIQSHKTGAAVMQRISFQSDEYPSASYSTPYLVHYAPGTVQNGSMDECVHNPPGQVCAGTYWFRPFSRQRLEYWDTRTVRNGAYDVTVVAWDEKGNTGRLTVPVVVANP